MQRISGSLSPQKTLRRGTEFGKNLGQVDDTGIHLNAVPPNVHPKGRCGKKPSQDDHERRRIPERIRSAERQGFFARRWVPPGPGRSTLPTAAGDSSPWPTAGSPPEARKASASAVQRESMRGRPFGRFGRYLCGCGGIIGANAIN